MPGIDFDNLWRIVTADRNRIRSRIHGPDHWARVERNGLYLCGHNDADEDIVRLFALFHDSMRFKDGGDPEHGSRGGEYARALLNKEYFLSRDRFALLYTACEYHNHERHTENTTIGTCWDSDRLDLERIGVRPSVEFLHTSEAKDIVQKRKWKMLEEQDIRPV